MTQKNVVVLLETDYLEQAAKARGISRSRLVQVVMDKVVDERLVSSILNDGDGKMIIPQTPRYRRFKRKASGASPAGRSS